jgi:hypothetical protein
VKKVHLLRFMNRRVFAEILRSFIQAVLEIGKQVKDPSRILRVLSSSRK